LNYGTGSSHPFIGSFVQKRGTEDFILIYRGKDSYGGKDIELYRFRKNSLSPSFSIGTDSDLIK